MYQILDKLCDWHGFVTAKVIGENFPISKDKKIVNACKKNGAQL